MANCIHCGRALPPFKLGKKICSWCVQHEAAQRGEAPEETIQPVMAAPWERGGESPMFVTPLFVAVNALVFVAMVATGISIMDPTSAQLVRWGANWGVLTLNGQWWRLLSSVFLHIGIIHIALNMWCLWNLGSMAESLFGSVTFTAVYLTCGVAGSVASVAWNPGGVSAGASGAIFGIAGALISSYYFGDFSLPRAVISAQLRSVVTFAGYNLFFGAVSGFVDNAAHIGGLVSGLLLGALIAKLAPGNHPVRRFTITLVVAACVAGCALWVRDSKMYMIHSQRAYSLLEENKNKEAIAELQASIQQRPHLEESHVQLAYAYFQAEEFDKAEAELKRALELEPADDDAWYRLGDLYEVRNRSDEAQKAYVKCLAINPRNAGCHFGVGYLAAQREDSETAAKEYGLVTSIDPKFEGAHFNEGSALAKLGRYDDAIAAYEFEKQVSGDSEKIELALADAYTAKGMQKEAVDAKQKAVKLHNAE